MPDSSLVPATATFAKVMHRALYDPTLGYYGRGPRRIGRSGDFYTAISVGPLYGKLLAQIAFEIWQSLGSPDDFTLIEQGAHDGQLAEDIWQGWPHEHRPRYMIIEPQPSYREAQRARLEPLMGQHITWTESVSSLVAHHASFFLSNELLDAFPVHRVRWTGSEWKELYVTTALEWVEDDVSESARAEVARLPTDLPTGYTTEVHPAAAVWMREMAALPFRGAILIADYGYEAAEYYTPERADGTLRRYFNHRSDGNVLDHLGECDLTAHINFTRIIEEAEAAGLTVERFMDQGRFLTHAATPWLKSLDGKPMSSATMTALRQFHTLTHPTHMGAAFRMLLLNRARVS